MLKYQWLHAKGCRNCSFVFKKIKTLFLKKIQTKRIFRCILLLYVTRNKTNGYTSYFTQLYPILGFQPNVMESQVLALYGSTLKNRPFFKKYQMYFFKLLWNVYVPIFSFLRQLLWLLSLKTSFDPLGKHPWNGLFLKTISNICFNTLMKFIYSNFHLFTSIIMAALVKNKFCPLGNYPWKRAEKMNC